MRNILDITDMKNKKVLLRVDFNVPVSEKGQIEEPFKIERQKESLLNKTKNENERKKKEDDY